MNICFISDTHGKHRDCVIPKGVDMLIHTGDISNIGKINEIEDFLSWFSNLEATYKIFIAGNHDFLFDKKHERCLYKDLDIESIIPSNVIYLYNETIEIEGIKIFGSPYSPFFYNWAFNKYGIEIAPIWDNIQEGTDIILTHTPPKGILDYTFSGDNAGCPYLRDKLLEIKPKINAFGHIHEAYGITEIDGVKYINSSFLYTYSEKDYNKPIVINYKK